MNPAPSILGKALETSTSDDFILQPPYSLVINDPKKGDYGSFYLSLSNTSFTYTSLNVTIFLP